MQYMHYCPQCGSQVREEDNFCSKCGAPLRNLKTGYVRRIYIGATPLWSILSGVMLLMSGFVSLYLLATAFESLPFPFKLSMIFVFITLIAIGVIFLVFGMKRKVIPTYRIKIE